MTAARSKKVGTPTRRPGVLLNLSSAAAAVAASTRQSCHWPMGGHVSGDSFHFCGAPAIEGKPYCEEHQKTGSAGRMSFASGPKRPFAFKHQEVARG